MQNLFLLSELQESEARFKAAFQSSAIGMGLLTLDGRVLQVNEAVLKLLGYAGEELLQQYERDHVHPDDRGLGGEMHRELLDGRRDWYQVEKRYIRKNGEIIWARVTLSAVRDADGRVLYLVGLLEDITGQRQALESLQESEARFRALFEHSAVGIGIMGLDRILLDMNPAACRMFGVSRQELVGKTPISFTHPDDLAESTHQYLDLISGKIDHYVTERRYVRKNGQVFWAQISMSMVRHADGTPNYIVGLLADITPQKEAQRRLAEQEADYLRMLQQRVNERTRELEASNILLQAEVEQRKKAEEALAVKAAEEAVIAERTRLARDLHDAVTQTLFSASLIAEVLPDLWDQDVEEAGRTTEELRQLTRGALAEMRTLLLELRPAALTQTRLPDLIKQLCEALIGRSRLPIQLTIEGDGSLPPDVQIAFYRIAQESLNNVIKYARASSVYVDLRVSPSSVQYSIRDDGIGFDPAEIKPTSLGMRIMRERAESIGADWHVESLPGAGTRVEAVWVKTPVGRQDGKETE